MAIRGLIWVLVIFCLAIFAPSLPGHAVEYGGLGGLPANPDPNNPRTKSIFVYKLIPGTSKRDGVSVVNNTSEPKTVEVYATDSEISSGGSFACRQMVDAKEQVGGWIQLDKTEVSLLPNTSQVVPFEIAVPKDASVGEHNGCIVIQEKNGEPTQSGNGVQLSFRSALRVAVTVPGDIIKNIEFNDLQVKKADKKYTFAALLSNKGNVSVDTDVKVIVKDLFNRNIYQNGGTYPLLAQKQSMELNFEFTRSFWGGLYRVLGTADYNNDANIALGVAAAKNIRKQAPSRYIFVPPQPLAAAVEAFGLLLLIIAAWIVWRRTQRRKKWEVYIVEQGDTLASLAKQHKTKWRTIAKVNKLRAPYELKTGSKVKLPHVSAGTRKR